MAKMTREERQAAKEAEAARVRAEGHSRRVQEFKATFLKQQARRIYSEKAVWDMDRNVDPTGAASGNAIYALVYEFKNTRVQLERELSRATAAMSDAVARMAAGRDPFDWSNGFTGRYGADIDQYATRLETLRKSIQSLADVTGWRVREVEAGTLAKRLDELATLDVVPCGGSWAVRKTIDVQVDGETRGGAGWRWLDADGTYGDTGVIYATEELAWCALHVAAHGQTLY